jgi:hypothetical protein
MKALICGGWRGLGQWSLTFGALLATHAAMAVESIRCGGPAVNQLDLHSAGHAHCCRPALAALSLYACGSARLTSSPFGVMFYLRSLGHRKSSGREVRQLPREREGRDRRTLIVPFIIVIFMPCCPATKTVVAMKAQSASDLTNAR